MTKKEKLPPGMRRLPSGNIRWEKMVDGKRFSGTCRTVTEARTAQSLIVADASRGGVVDPSTVTVTEYLEGWLDGKRPSRAQRTNSIQAAHLRTHITPLIGDLRLQKLAPAHLKKLFDHLTRSGLGASSQRQVHQMLVTALGDAYRLELVARNVAQVVKPTPKRGQEEKALPAFTAAEASAFVNVARQEIRGPVFIFALSTGMRRGELCGLRWTDVDLERAVAQVTEVVAHDEGETIVTTPKTGNSRRTVHLAPSAVQLLRDVQAEQARLKSIFDQPVKGHTREYTRKRPWVDSGRVFTNSFGATLDPHNLRRDMQRLCELAGVRTISIHGLRHTYASLSLMRGVPIEVVSKQLGHASVAFTLSQYRWVYREERERWALGIDELVSASD